MVKNLIRYAQDNHYSFSQLFQSFIEDMDQMLDKCRHAVSLNNGEELIKIFLNIRGLAGNFGATQLGIVVKLVEAQIGQNQELDKEILLALITDKYFRYRDNILKEYHYLFSDS